ncbi:KUP/HAK/KT family potassium transporter [Polynucleobacter sp. es-MAR-4]|uniref:KUP/HAK/KT family potassium transporter n=1 Tax=Polynucleobacter sp. es-MAR-4 TaxID=1855655 RepID=UPI001C0BB335|nr:KUP/HAK/KT family potassium transporter [Polynucleobacter sp. es-MAR-4]MBU3636327.1 KUP/HAK/KT family potassium transporter [Polynucleobacter sp. es-MAR-4]
MHAQLSNQKIYSLALAALGIVYGDIGTSPLYAFEQVFNNGFHSVPTSEANILGVLSLFFWCLVMVVTVKYVAIVMRANHAGEGGIIALMRILLERSQGKPFIRGLLIFSGLVGAAFFYGDGVITPAISVLSAVEGMEVVSPALQPYVIPVALTILVGLFWGQRFGTGKIGILFGPAMVIWFAVLALLGLLNIAENPHVLLAMRPIYAQEFISNNGLLPFFALGAVVLCVTGAEALYADMGHFGPRPIKLAWIGFVLPALLLNYFGQGALLLKSPESLNNLFYLMAPASFHVAFVVFATFATVIASQAVISGAFSITKQAVELGFLPKMRIIQTSQHDAGQIYVPAINLMLLVMVVVAVLLFKSSTALAGAYGIAVTGTMLLTDFLGISVAIVVWRWHPIAAMAGGLFFILMDLAFFSSNSLKFMDGGWFPLGMSIVLIVVMAIVFWKSSKTKEI